MNACNRCAVMTALSVADPRGQGAMAPKLMILHKR